MSVKSIKKQLAAAIAMVLVAAVALGSSTYAWFASNNTVTADGLSVKAQIEGSALVISDTENGTKEATVGTSVKLAFETAEALYPTHVKMNTIPSTYGVEGDMATAQNTWTHATSDKYDTAISRSTEVPLTITASGKTGVYTGSNDTTGFSGNVYITDDLYIAVKDSNSFDHLYVSKCDITGADAKMLSSARVLMVVTDKNNAVKTYQFGPNGVLRSESDATHIITSESFDALTGGKVVDLGEIDNNEMHVQVFVYFDGRDVDCTSAKYDANAISISLEFTGEKDRT